MAHVQERVTHADRHALAPGGVRSLLFLSDTRPKVADPVDEPAYFRDLNLDQVVRAAVLGRDDDNLEPLYRLCMKDRDGVAFRQAIFKDIETDGVHDAIDRFATGMRNVRSHIDVVAKLHHVLRKQSWQLAAVIAIVGADYLADQSAALASFLVSVADVDYG
ncbi:MAG: hypothetical protein ACR2F6_11465 [Mycobacteriales bacterium]